MVSGLGGYWWLQRWARFVPKLHSARVVGIGYQRVVILNSWLVPDRWFALQWCRGFNFAHSPSQAPHFGLL
jgi:hypothetical protein